MLLVICTLIVLGYSLAFVLTINHHKEKIEKMAGMTLVMVFVMFSSVTIGLFLGIYFTSDLTLSTILAILYGLGLGYFTGKAVSFIVIIEGLGAGMMGGMMGAMLGDMLPGGFKLMVIFMTILFILTVSILAHFIKTETIKSQEKPALSPRPHRLIFSLITSSVIIFTTAGLEEGRSKNIPNTHLHHNHSSIESNE